MINWVPGMTLEEIEKQSILQALRFYRGNKTQTSISLGIAIRTLDNKLEKYEAEGKLSDARIEDERRGREEILNRMRGIKAPESKTSSNGSNAGLRVEPIIDAPKEYAMPVSEPEEVQNVLHGQASQDRKPRGRPRLQRTNE